MSKADEDIRYFNSLEELIEELKMKEYDEARIALCNTIIVREHKDVSALIDAILNLKGDGWRIAIVAEEDWLNDVPMIGEFKKVLAEHNLRKVLYKAGDKE